jgi:hypothetical protein
MALNIPTPHAMWLSLYTQKSCKPTGSLSLLDDKPLRIFDTITKSLTSKPKHLQLHIAGNSLNFFLIQGGAKNVRILHQAFITAPQPNSSPINININI